MFYSTAGSLNRTSFRQSILLKVYLIAFLGVWVTTFVHTTNQTNWFTENTLTALFLVTLLATYRKFRFSDLSYTLMFVYLLLHVYGAEYTYAENPFGYWLKDTLHLQRNPYDRMVHFSFGFLLAYPMRDFFKNWFSWPAWVCWVLPVEITLSFSGLYELIEWAVADIFFPSEGVAYLGTQGDVWDAQKDMGIAYLGSMLAMGITFSLKSLVPTPSRVVAA